MKSLRLIVVLMLLMFGAGTAQAGDNIEFNFQGRIFSGGQPINGSAYVKFALIDSNGTTSVWSNDESSVACSEPATAVPVSVDSGIFDVMIGDTTTGMEPIHGALFNGRDDLRLRIWLSDGVNGFEQLTPDRRIPNADLLGLKRLTQPLRVYVNGTTGNNANSGLTSDRPKKTIQAAVDMVPHLLNSNTTIDIADGVYREMVNIINFKCAAGGSLTLLGDAFSTDAEITIPKVRITGTNNDATHEIVRPYCVYIADCTSLILRGILADYGSSRAISIDRSAGTLDRVRSGKGGFEIRNNSVMTMQNTWGFVDGFNVRYGSYVQIVSGGAKNCGRGLFLDGGSMIGSIGTFKFDNCDYGIAAAGGSTISLHGYGKQISNCDYGIYLVEGSVGRNVASFITFSANATNIFTETGGATYIGGSYPNIY